MKDFNLPNIDKILKSGASIKVKDKDNDAIKFAIVDVLNNFKVGVERISTTIGPRVILVKLVLSGGTRINKIKSIQDEIALSLNAQSCRLIQLNDSIAIEIPNPKPNVVSLKECYNTELKGDLPIVLGKLVDGNAKSISLNETPHLLVAGATGQGKSVFINVLLTSLMLKVKPQDLRLVLIDPKRVELGIYNDAKAYLMTPVITDAAKAISTLKSLCFEMDDRYNLLQHAGARNITEYNAKVSKLNPDHGHRHLPYIVTVIDEFADLMLTGGKVAEASIVRIAQLARAVGIHLVVATQRPSTDVISGLIKANFPTRIAFRTASNMDSRTILDAGGAEDLLGNGDMLYSKGTDLIRLQCPFISTDEVVKVINHVRKQEFTDETNYLIDVE